LCTALGTYILGLGYDLTGGYDLALYLLLTLPILAVIGSFVVKHPSTKQPAG
jgi:cyanate permease